MKRYALKIMYHGENYFGFQRQPGKPTIEGEVLGALKELRIISDEKEAQYAASGRTDRKVSAIEQVIAFTTNKELAEDDVLEVNDVLPSDIAVWGFREVPGEFHPRYWALRREYAYIIDAKQAAKISVSKLSSLIGRKNYAVILKCPIASYQDPFRQVIKVCIRMSTSSKMLSVTADSFLRQMVRRIVGMAIVGKPVPLKPENLVLTKVVYNYSFKVLRGSREKCMKILTKVLKRESSDLHLIEIYVLNSSLLYLLC